jgi:aspartyl/asparaginyl beta-hydroxylase (cupin superfamily)
MKLSVDQKKVCVIEQSLIDDFLSIIDENDWYVANYRDKAGNMSDTNSIPIMHTKLCASGLNSMKAIDDIKPEPLYEKYKNPLNLILQELKKYYEFDKYSAFLARLKPNGVIGSHIDSGKFLTLCHRIHVPLQTNSNVEYLIDNKKYYWEIGNAYEFDNTRMHGVINNSNEYRIHLVINLYPKGI